MPKTEDDKKWDAKNARELFCKTFNSLIMTYSEAGLTDEQVARFLEVSGKVVNKAMTLYNYGGKEEEEVEPDFPVMK